MRDPFLQAAIDEAKQGLAEGGIPIGSVIVYHGEIIGRGHNMRVQKGDPLLHGEMSAFQQAGRQPAEQRPVHNPVAVPDVQRDIPPL